MSEGPPALIGGGIAGAGTLPIPGGGGVAPPGPPIFWRRDFRSILGFLSSAIVDSARPYVPRRLNVNAAATVARIRSPAVDGQPRPPRADRARLTASAAAGVCSGPPCAHVLLHLLRLRPPPSRPTPLLVFSWSITTTRSPSTSCSTSASWGRRSTCTETTGSTWPASAPGNPTACSSPRVHARPTRPACRSICCGRSAGRCRSSACVSATRPSAKRTGARRPCRAPHARQDVSDSPRRPRRLRGHRVAFRRDAISFAARRARLPARLPRDQRLDGRRRDHGTDDTASTTSRAFSFTPRAS